MPVSRHVLPGSSKKPAPNAKLIAKTDGTEQIEVTVILARKTPIKSDDLHAHALVRPQERPAVDHAAFAERFGASDESIAAVSSFAASFGLRVVSVDRNRRVMRLAGSVSDMERAFGTSINNYSMAGHAYRGRQGPLLLPSAILGHVEAVLGLDNRRVAKPRLRSRAAQTSYYPNQLAEFYNFPAGDGTDQTIALIELGGNLGADDLKQYFSAAGTSQTPNVEIVSVDPGVPVPYGQDPKSDGEVMLDIEVVGAMAPGATIRVYFAQNTDQGFYEAVSQAVHHPSTTAVSISWGSPEKDWTEQSMNAWLSLGEGATLLNVPIFVAAGDHGCTDESPNDDGYDGQCHVDFPGSCAAGVVSCGGTSVTTNAGTIVLESVWNEGDGWATGGGISTFFPVPAWQNAISADGQTLANMRGVPDVAADADSNTGIKVRVNGADSVSGGTSAVAPQWAALTAILSQKIGRKVGFFIPLLYSHTQSGATNGVVAGNNSVFGVNGFSARAGWNACTGLGSPDGKKLLALLSGSSPIVDVPPPENQPPVGLLPVTEVGSTAGATNIQAPKGQAFDSASAVLYGQFVQSAYSMYHATPNSLTPSPTSDFPAGYELVAWIQMQDFIIGSTGLTFYGYIAQSNTESNRFILAIRGTSNAVEWWDDANAILKTPFKVAGCGSVGCGFARIYDTLQLIERPSSAAAAVPQSLRAVGSFSQQVATAISRRLPPVARVPGFSSSASVEVTGHSLGAALATLYTMENGYTNQLQNPAICTFASPHVGDTDFVAAFNGLGLTSWRVVNQPDLVPLLPPEILGFAHVDTLQPYNSSGKVEPSPSCWHSLATYLNLIDQSQPLDPACQLPQAGRVAAEVGTSQLARTLSILSGPVTVKITVKADNPK